MEPPSDSASKWKRPSLLSPCAHPKRPTNLKLTPTASSAQPATSRSPCANWPTIGEIKVMNNKRRVID